MKDFIKKHAPVIALFSLILLIYFIFYISGIGCPIKFLTGISCAGCGMTRAFLCVLTLNFKSAFTYHPLWFTVPITAFLLIFFHIKKMKSAYNTALYSFAFLMLAVYITRLFTNGDVVVFEPQNGAILNLISKIFKTSRN